MEYTLDTLNEEVAHKEYKKINIPYKFTLEQIDHHLKSKYKAVKISSKLFPELNQDPNFNSSYLTKCYAIQSDSVLSNLFNDEEKADHDVYMKKYGSFDTQIDHANPENRIHAISNGLLLYIFFQSEDGKYLSSFISTHGPCEKIMSELTVFKGIEPSNCVLGNIEYKLYLLSLVKAGYIQIDI